MNNGKICVSVCAETVEKLIQQIRRAEEFADVIEVRFDCLEKDDVRNFIVNLPAIEKTYLFTYRPSDQGGKREINLDQRLKFWELIFSTVKSDFMIDVECEPNLILAVDPQKTQRIVSFHDFDGTPDNLGLIWSGMSELSNGMVKIAVKAMDITDSIAIWKLIDQAKSEKKQIIPIAMGEAGKWTRILGLAYGAFMTYASLDAGKETADGQIKAKDLIETYRVKELDENTQVYGVIGDPISQSLSPFMHNPAFAAAGINAVFLPLSVKNLDEFMRRMVMPKTREVELNFAGFSVTMPHKQTIMRYLDAIDPTAEKIGAVNTVKVEDGKLFGYNTDAHGFISPLKAKFGDVRGSRVAVFGAGGAARACVHALKEEKADVTVFARDAKKGEAFAGEFGVGFKEISNFKFQISHSNWADFDIVVDATPTGMKGALEQESLFSAEQLARVKFVYDLVTKAVDTSIIREAKKAGIPAIGGLEMLIAQGAKQFEIWTGREAPVDMMRNSLLLRMEA